MSSMCKRNIRQLLCFMALVMTILMSCSPSISLFNSSNSSSSISSDSAGFYTDMHESLESTNKQLFFTILSAQLALQEIKQTQKTPGRIKIRQSSSHIGSGVQILLLTSMLLFIHNSVCLVGKKSKRISVLAFSTGGHSPPSTQA